MVRGKTKGRKYWQKQIEDYESSGLSQQEYADKEGLSVWTLRAWIARFRDEQAAEGDGLDDLLVEAARKHGKLTSSQVADALKIDQRQARKYLQWLVEEGRLRRRGRARATVYLPLKKRAR